jgi:hypothetical protein
MAPSIVSEVRNFLLFLEAILVSGFMTGLIVVPVLLLLFGKRRAS